MRFAVLFKAALTVFALGMSACATSTDGGPKSQSNGVDKLAQNQSGRFIDGAAPSQSTLGVIATDLVSSLVQLSELSPFSTTIQVNRSVSDFGDELIRALRYSGYGVQIVPDDQGLNYLDYITSFSEADDGNFYSFELVVRDISISRTFIESGNTFIPSSPVTIKGVAAQRIVVNDDIYRQSIGNAEFPSGVSFVDRTGEQVYYDPRLVVSTNAMKRNANDQIKTEMVLIHARANLFTKSRITASEKRNFEPYKQVSLRFRPKSLDLGVKNKSAIGLLLESFDVSTDRLSITACNFGKSLMWDGTESVALERGLRVRQELLASNISIDHTRDESCFSTKYGDKLPRRTVLLTLERAVRIL